MSMNLEKDRFPTTFRQLLGYLVDNQGRDCFSKFQGKVWMISKHGTWIYVCKSLPDLSLKDYLKLSKA